MHKETLLGRSFLGMTVTQFLGAFNDNLFKQMILLMSLSPAGAGAADNPPRDLQAPAMFIFGGAFLIWSGLAGYLSERYSKTWLVIASKWGEVAVMALGMLAFAAYGSRGLWPLLAVLFLMGTQSAFFGPPKYGILPEMLDDRRLPAANGLFMMTTFLAILFGTVLAGTLSQTLADRLWIAGVICVAIAVAGSLSAMLIRRLPPVRPKLNFGFSTLTMPPDVRRLLWNDRPLLIALLASCAFWLVAGIVLPAVNALGKLQLELSDSITSRLTACVGLGIAAGCLLAGWISGGRVNVTVMRTGSWGIVGCLVLLSISDMQGRHLLGLYGSPPVLLALGIFTGMFAVPLQVFLQMRPPPGMKGRTIATMNQFNWVAIVASAILYGAFVVLLERFKLPRSATFGLTALLMFPVALCYRPQVEPASVSQPPVTQ